MGAAMPFIPLIAMALPMILPAVGLGPDKPEAPKSPTAQQGADQVVHQAGEPPKAPTLADASIERARRRSSTSSIRSETLRTKPQGLLDDGETTAGGSLI